MENILGSPCRIGKLMVKNRVIMEAMGNALSELNGEVSKADIAFYEARAKGGVGLIMSEAVSVDSVTGRANPRNMCIDQDYQIPGYRKLAEAVHAYDCKYFVELFKGLDYKEGYKVLQREIKQRGEHIPPLINSYMNLSSSMRMFGTAINAGFGGVEESGILVKINDIYPEKLERHVAPLIAWAQKIRVKWWKNR